MNSDELKQNLQDLTERLTRRQEDLNSDNLQEYLDEVASSLTQVFALAQEQIDRGLEQIELAKDCLSEQDMGSQAEAFEPILEKVLLARNQLELGREVARQKRSLDVEPGEISKQDLLTPKLRGSLEKIETILSEVSSL